MNVIKTYQNVFIASFFAQKVLALILDIIQNICHNFLFPWREGHNKNEYKLRQEMSNIFNLKFRKNEKSFIVLEGKENDWSLAL